MEYQNLPPVLQYLLQPKEFLWLSDAEKDRVAQQMTEPDYTEDLIE
jgi:hypothetical protein